MATLIPPKAEKGKYLGHRPILSRQRRDFCPFSHLRCDPSGLLVLNLIHKAPLVPFNWPSGPKGNLHRPSGPIYSAYGGNSTNYSIFDENRQKLNFFEKSKIFHFEKF